MFSPRQQKLISQINTYQTGENRGKATNERLRELQIMLNSYSYDDRELTMLEHEVMGATPPRALKKMFEESERQGAK